VTVVADADAGAPVDDAGAAPDAGGIVIDASVEADAGVTFERDAAVHHDAGKHHDAGEPVATAEGDTDAGGMGIPTVGSNGGCSVARGAEPSPAPFLLLGVAVLFRRRRGTRRAG